MINFNNIESPLNLSSEFILSKLDESQIFFYYFGHFELGKVYPSKFRKDRSPSTGFFIHPQTRSILYNDLGTGEKLNCFQFVAKLYGCSYYEALKKIASDFGLSKSNTASTLAQQIINQTVQFDREFKKETNIQFLPSSWDNTTLAYWKQYEVSKERLIKEDVYPVKRLFINKIEYSVDDVTFAYLVKEKDSQNIEKTYVKIYSPFNKERKWLSNIPLTVPFGLNNLKYGTDHVRIAKAQKDRLVLLNIMDSVIGTQNESEAALTNKLIKHLCFNFPRRTIIWDSDDTGVQNCKKFNSRGFGYFNTPKHLLEKGIKDVSDYVKAFGMKELEKLLISKNII